MEKNSLDVIKEMTCKIKEETEKLVGEKTCAIEKTEETTEEKEPVTKTLETKEETPAE